MASRLVSILIVDQQEVLRLGMRTLLSREGWKIIAEAEDGREALNLAKTHHPDIVILENAISSINGLDLSKEILSHSPLCKIILFVGSINDELISAYIQAGVKGIILKSENFEEMTNCVRNLLFGRRYFSSLISDFMINKICDCAEEKPFALTSRERQVTQLIAEGRLNKQVAYTLGVSTKTIESHRAAIMNKLNFGTTAQLVRYAVRNNLVAP